MSPTKTCTACGETKQLDDFNKKKEGKLGRASRCRECIVETQRRYYDANREKRNEYSRRYREANRGTYAAQVRNHYKDNQELSIALATTPPRARWTSEEEQFLMADNGMTIYQKATQLGRTYASCTLMRVKLRKLATERHTTP